MLEVTWTLGTCHDVLSNIKIENDDFQEYFNASVI